MLSLQPHNQIKPSHNQQQVTDHTEHNISFKHMQIMGELDTADRDIMSRDTFFYLLVQGIYCLLVLE